MRRDQPRRLLLSESSAGRWNRQQGGEGEGGEDPGALSVPGQARPPAGGWNHEEANWGAGDVVSGQTHVSPFFSPRCRSCPWTWSPFRGPCSPSSTSSLSTRPASWRTPTGLWWNTSESRESSWRPRRRGFRSRVWDLVVKTWSQCLVCPLWAAVETSLYFEKHPFLSCWPAASDKLFPVKLPRKNVLSIFDMNHRVTWQANVGQHYLARCTFVWTQPADET